MVNDYDKARLALRLIINGSSGGSSWVTDTGMLNEAVLGDAAAPSAGGFRVVRDIVMKEVVIAIVATSVSASVSVSVWGVGYI